MDATTAIKRFASDTVFWVVATVLGVAVPTLAAYVGLNVVRPDVARPSMAAALSATAILTLTWGSWSGLVWSNHRLLRSAMRSMTVVPGVLLMGAAGLGIYVGLGSLVVWLGLLATGAGTVVACFLLANRVGRAAQAGSTLAYVTGLGVFPVLATLGAATVAGAWYLFIRQPIGEDWRAIFQLSSFFVTVLGSVLISSIIPAVTTVVCRRFVDHR